MSNDNNGTALHQENQNNQKNFDLYNHLKQNILQSDINCNDAIGKDSIYCIDCLISSCPKCGLENHKGHTVLYREKYLQTPSTFFEAVDREIQESAAILKLKNEFEQSIEETFCKLHAQLDKMRQCKLDELETVFTKASENITELTSNTCKIKQEFNDYFEKTKTFLALNENNFDKENTFFLINYEMMLLCEGKNNEVITTMKCLREDLNQYKNDLQSKAQEIINEYKRILSDHSKLTDKYDDFYWNISLRANKYLDHIQKMQLIMGDIVQHKGHLELVKDLVELMDSKNSKGIEYIFNQNYFSNTPNQFETNKLKKIRSNSRMKISKSSFHSTDDIHEHSNKKLLNKSLANCSFSGIFGKYKTKNNLDYSIALDTQYKQRYFAYSIIDLYNKNFSTSQRASFDTNSRVLDSYKVRFARLKEQSKPIIGTNELLIHDSVTNQMSKKKIILDKEKHGYITFPSGNRHIIINDWIYITGGTDGMKNPLRIALRINILTGEVERLEQMTKGHSFHSIDFLENYNCFIIIGGENNNKTVELFDLMSQKWTKLPDLTYGRANCNIYFNQYTSEVYAMFGMKGTLSELNNNMDSIEVLELNDVNSGWIKVDYYKSASLDFKISSVNVIPFTKDKLLIIGSKNARTKGRLYAFFLINKSEIIVVDEAIMEEIKVEEKKVKAYNTRINKIK